ncbi:MAG TPA: hypothetical protein VL200_13970 [Lacunisphaera sp.]|jgi:hypothetical protein|nr:hypothetical protein [Lacunisphaera sp.]
MTTAAHQPLDGFPGRPTLDWILRLGLFFCFLGHGMLGLSKVAAWTSYFAVVGIGPDHALDLMPWVGVFDVALGIAALFFPIRWLVFYMFLWTLWTALLRPLAGESIWEAVERAGNYGVPFALFLLLTPGGSLNAWLRGAFGPRTRELALHWTLRLTTVLLLFGHGMLNWAVLKPLFVKQYSVLGLPGLPVERGVGVFECLLALAVLIKPDSRMLVGIVVWKLATEILNPMAGSPIWVFIEHGGSYAAPLALAFLVARSRTAVSAPAAITT